MDSAGDARPGIRKTHQLFALQVFEPPGDIQRRLPGFIGWMGKPRKHVITIVSTPTARFLSPSSIVT